MGRVVVLGSLNVDLVVDVQRHPRPGETVLAHGDQRRFAGGKGGNQAVAAAAAGVPVTMVGAVGDDDGGTAYRRRLRERGIDVGSVRTLADVPTGQAWIAVDDAGENAIVVIAGANGRVEAEALPDLRPDDVLLVQLEVPIPTIARAVRAAHGRGARVVVNAAPYAALPADVAALADPMVVNEHEAMQLGEAGVVPGSLLVTFGAAGCSWDGEQFHGTPVEGTEVVDTTGAGDAFCGALAAALAQGADRATAVAAAMAAGADTVRHHGAQREAEL